jgi:hypothetical protein
MERSMMSATVTIEAIIRNQIGHPAAWIIENKCQLQEMHEQRFERGAGGKVGAPPHVGSPARYQLLCRTGKRIGRVKPGLSDFLTGYRKRVRI